MDALYGRTFMLRNISKEVLHHLDDFFGPVSIETVSQVIHFASANSIADKVGINRFVSPSRLSERFDFPLMSIHGEENGLADVATLDLMRTVLKRAGIPQINDQIKLALTAPERTLSKLGRHAAGLLRMLRRKSTERTKVIRSQRQITSMIDNKHCDLSPGRPSYLTWRIEGHGHQDCLIGNHAAIICEAIARYLNTPDVSRSSIPKLSARERLQSCEAVGPAFGVRIRVLKKAAKVLIQASDSSGRGAPLRALIVPVKRLSKNFSFDGGPRGHEIPSSYEDLQAAGVRICKPIKSRRRKREENWPWFFELGYASWPSHASEVLLLLLYDQAEGIGGNVRLPGPASITPRSKSVVSRAIQKALSCDSIDLLLGGLISGRLPGQSSEDRVTIAFASCQYPSDILNHMPSWEDATIGVADASLLRLSSLLGKTNSPSLLLLAGDQIYTDATAGLFDPKVKDERYRIPHERRGESRGSRAVMQRLDLDVHMMADDHEIRDNWAPNDPQLSVEELKRAKLAYFLYERALPYEHAHLWYKLYHRGLPFFLADTRTEREARTATNWRTARIMGARQCDRLQRWLVAPRYRNKPKFVMTASALLPRRLAMANSDVALTSDSWDGYPLSRNALLKFICDGEINGVVFLSGDEHVSSVTTAKVYCKETDKCCMFHSIHSSGLFSPYSFANGSSNDFIEDDLFEFAAKSSEWLDPHVLLRS